MRKYSWSILILMACLILLGSCTRTTSSQLRRLPAGIDSWESIVILLNYHKDYGEISDQESKEGSLETCMKEAISDEKPKLNIVSAADFLRTLFPGSKLDKIPRSPEAFLSILGDEDIRAHLVKLRIRYLVIVDIETSRSKKETDFQFAINFPGWGIGQKWLRTSDFHADILDVSNHAVSGEVRAHSSGEAGYIVPIFFILPLPPIPYSVTTETDACLALGKAVHKFIVERSEPASN